WRGPYPIARSSLHLNASFRSLFPTWMPRHAPGRLRGAPGSQFKPVRGTCLANRLRLWNPTPPGHEVRVSPIDGKKRTLSAILVDSGIITDEQVDQAFQRQLTTGRMMGETL